MLLKTAIKKGYSNSKVTEAVKPLISNSGLINQSFDDLHFSNITMPESGRKPHQTVYCHMLESIDGDPRKNLISAVNQTTNKYNCFSKTYYKEVGKVLDSVYSRSTILTQYCKITHKPDALSLKFNPYDRRMLYG